MPAKIQNKIARARENMGNKLLIIDDDEEMCSELTDILRREGYQTEFSLDGLSGKKMILNNKYDLVLLDLKISKLNGFGVLKFIKDNNIKVNVIVISGRPMFNELKGYADTYNAEEEEILKFADSVINKPFDINHLIKRVGELTSRVMP